MTFASLPAPRKLSTLDAAVSGGAFLVSPGLVAMLTTGPVRLAVLPMAGGPAVVSELSLGSGSEIALLSKNVAVVRSADETVWAVLDLTGTPKVREVARDVRSLRMRPTGESALALGADGGVTALLLNRDEVGARAFRLRTAVRACDVGESETYAVVDGEIGVEFRVHPGSTPESSASARIPLPVDAVGLDRLRGSRELSVLYKRGSPTLCVITGAAGKLEAKIIRIESAPFDIAVLEGSLFVAFADGRVALYVPDAIARAGDAELTAKSILTFAAAGKPRVLLATSKGSPTIWIGTSTGEVLGLALTREAPREAPKTVPPAPAEPRKDERAAALIEMDRLKDELAAAAAARAEVEVKLEAAGAAHQAEIDRIGAAHQAATDEINEQKSNAKAAYAAAIQTLQIEIDTLRANEERARAAAEERASAAHLELQASNERARSAEERVAAVHLELQASEERARAAAEERVAAIHLELRASEERARSVEERMAAMNLVLQASEERTRSAEQGASSSNLEHQASEERARSAEERASAANLELQARGAELVQAKEKLEAGDQRLRAHVEERDRLAAELESRTNERDSIQVELAEARSRLDSLEAERASLSSALEERTRERDIERSVAERLAAELEETRTKSGEGRVSIEHARDLLGALVSQVRETFLKRPRD